MASLPDQNIENEQDSEDSEFETGHQLLDTEVVAEITAGVTVQDADQDDDILIWDKTTFQRAVDVSARLVTRIIEAYNKFNSLWTDGGESSRYVSFI